MHTEKDIQRLLRAFFINHKYRLINAFVFKWESDFFCVSKSDYAIECEVKISKSDFRKDFEKDKHVLFKNSLKGVWLEKSPEVKKLEYYNYNIRKYDHADYCTAKWHDPVNYNIPNRFYYVVPEGVINVKEVPAYAGLLVIKGASIVQVKSAPFLHKRKLVLETKMLQILLDKFWYLSQNQRYHLVVNNIQFKDCYEEK